MHDWYGCAMDLQHLRAFMTLYRAGSVTAAAEALHVTQPAMSRTLRAIEAQVGYRLFDRSRAGLTPTKPAAHLFASIAPSYDALRERMAGADDNAAPTLPVFVAGPSELMPRMVHAAATADDAPSLRIQFGHDDETVAALVAGDADIGVLVEQAQHPAIVVEPLLTERFDLVAAPAWSRRLDASTRDATPAELRDVPLLSFDERGSLAAHFWERAFLTGLDIVPHVVVNDHATLRDLAIRGIHVSAGALAAGDLAPLVSIDHSPSNIVYLAWRPAAIAAHANARRVRDLMRAVARAGELPT